MGRIGLRQYILLAILAFCMSVVAVFVVQKTIITTAAPGINKKINFQGKMTDSDGLNVADGNYQFVFNMYSVSSGGSSLWSETVNLDVQDGIFHHNLGSSTALPGSVDFDTDNIYLGITFNSDPDGEMSPRIQLTASAYAFNSDQLDGLDAADFVQISPSGAQTGNIAVTGSVSAGSLLLSDGSSNTGTIQMNSISSNYVYTIPTTTGNDTFCLYSLANCGNTNAFVQNGNSFTAAAVLGTNDAYALQFETANNVRMTIASNGNATIGSASDYGQLAVVNDTAGDVALAVRAAGSQSANIQEWQNSSGSALTYITSRGSLVMNTAAYAGGDTVIDINNSGSTIFRVNKGSSNGSLFVMPFASSNIGIVVRGQSGQSANLQEWWNSTPTVVASISGAGNFMTTGTANIGSHLTVDTDTLYVDATNNRVGIGDATPDYRFDVETSGAAGGAGTSETLASFSLTDTGVVTSGSDTSTALAVTSTRNNATGGSILSMAGNFAAVADNGGSAATTAIGLNASAYGADISYAVKAVGYTAGNTVTDLIGVDSMVGTFLAGGTVTNMMGLQSQVNTSSVAATVSTAAGLYVKTAAKHASGTITDNYGIKIDNQTAGTNDYGLYIQGADTYALWVDSGTSRFDGNLRVEDADLTVMSGTDRLFTVDNTNNRVGIGVPNWASLDYSYQAYLSASTTQSHASVQYAQLGGSTSLNQTAYEFQMGLTNPASTAYLTHTNMKSFMSFDLTANTADNNFTGFNISNYSGGSGTASTMTGLHVDLGPSSSGTVNTLYGIRVQNGSGSGGTVWTRQGIRIDDIFSGGTTGDNYGMYIANHTNGTNDYGIYIQNADTYALFVDDGATRLDGTLTVGSTVTYVAGSADTNTAVCQNAAGQLAGCTSASRFKDDVQDLSIGLDELRLLQPVSYTWNTTGKADIGFLAEQVAAVIPQAVTYDEFGEISSFNYNTISALLVSSTKQLDVRVTTSDDRLFNLEQRLAVIEQSRIDPTSLPTLTVSGNVLIGGRLTIGGKLITSGLSPVASSTAGQAEVSGNDTAGTVSFTAGDAAAKGTILNAVFSSAYSSQPRVVLTPTNANSASAKYFVERSASEFKLNFVELTKPGEVYTFDYLIVQ